MLRELPLFGALAHPTSFTFSPRSCCFSSSIGWPQSSASIGSCGIRHSPGSACFCVSFPFSYWQLGPEVLQ